MPKTIHIASDHAGFTLKAAVIEHLAKHGRAVRDHGTGSAVSCDYPAYAQVLCRALLAQGGLGILICGSGIGMSMAANRFQGIRAALCMNEFLAAASRRHTDANVLCLGERVIGRDLAFAIVDAFLQGEFEGGRHQNRITMFDRHPDA